MNDKHIVLNTTDIRAAELNAVATGLPLLLLMENAGKAVADKVEEALGDVEGRKIIVYAGRGGNAGDGLVAARHLASRGARVEVLLYYPPETIQHPDTRLNLTIIQNMESIKITRIRDPDGVLPPPTADAYIDALLGIGFTGTKLRHPVRGAVETFNSGAAYKVAIDVPTGLDADTGKPAEPTVIADETVTMEYMKPGLQKPEAKPYAGKITVAKIGIPREALLYAGPGDAIYRIPPKPSNAHKGTGGRVAVIGGSSLYTGAPALAGLAALRTGADLAFIYTGRDAGLIIAGFSPNLIVRRCPRPDIDLQCIEEKLDEIKKAHAIIIGPGLGPVDPALPYKVIEETLGADVRGLVVDADALKALAKKPTKLDPRVVFTPHRGEAALLLGLDKPPQAKEELIETAQRIAAKYNATVLLKAPIDVIAAPDGRFKLNKTHHQAMSVGGTGDVLTGITAALLARGLNPFHAAAIAAYANGKAGLLAVEDYGERITATDLIERIPAALTWKPGS